MSALMRQNAVDALLASVGHQPFVASDFSEWIPTE